MPDYIAVLTVRTLVTIAAAMFAIGCSPAKTPSSVPTRFASAEQVEETFRSRTFVLGDNASVALVRPTDAAVDQWIKLPFWFGLNVMVPGVLQPKEGDYYVISEARLVKELDIPGEWMIEAGSSLIKRETVFITTRTHYVGSGTILPTIVQFTGMREFKNEEGNPIQIPVLREVSLPMKWPLGGAVPASYARYRTG
jgi:hypothetical protein